jgi:ketosteroid isomerase-like protein
MPSANLELVRAIRAAWDRGEFAAVEWAHPGIEFVIADGPTPGRWAGLAGMAAGWREFLSDWEDWRARATSYQEVDDGRVIAFVELSGRNRASGLEIGQMGGARGANVFHLRDGQVTRFVLYLDRARALADLGLPPEPPDAEAR